MPSFSQKTFSSFFNRILQIGNSGNTGTSSSTTIIESGDGTATSISLSDDVLSVQPVNDNTVRTFAVFNQGGSSILAVDTTDSLVKVGASQVHATTQYAYFGVESNESASWSADTHYIVPFVANSLATAGDHAIGTGTNPDTTLTITGTADNIVSGLWYLPDNITVDAVHWWHGADAGTGDTTKAHLMSYAIVSDNSSTSGDLSDGTVVADGANITNAGFEQAYYQSMTVQSADVDAGRVLIFTFRSDSAVNSDYTINATVKYHIR